VHEFRGMTTQNYTIPGSVRVTWSRDTVAMVAVLQEFDDAFQSVQQPTVPPVTQLFQSSAYHGHGNSDT